MKRALGVLVMFGLCASSALAVQPQVWDLDAGQRAGANLVEIRYSLSDLDSDAFDVSAHVYVQDKESSFAEINASSFAGMVGSGIGSGTNSVIFWDAGKDWPSNSSSLVWVKVLADDFTTRNVPTNEMVPVPAGWFNMGDPYAEGRTREHPLHAVYVSDFWIGKYEITNLEMQRVLQWAYDYGLITCSNSLYSIHVYNTEGNAQHLAQLKKGEGGSEVQFSNGAFSIESGREFFPMRNYVTWYGAQAYCNFRSEMEGLESCVNFADWSCDFSKNGYRLPTEAEWEKAARGGLDGHHFSWPSVGGSYMGHVDGSKANYYVSGDLYESNPYETPTPVGYYNGNQSPPGCNMANGYGLYDTVGNVSEWCYDWFAEAYYSASPILDPIGPSTGEGDMSPARVNRGGAFDSAPETDCSALRCAARSYETPMFGFSSLGFRIARSQSDITPQYVTIRSEMSSICGPVSVNTTATTNPGIVQFSASSAAVDENAGTATLTVMRMGGTQGTATVDYVTVNGTAIGGTDFTATSGTVSWLDGDNTNQTITVNLTADSSSEGDETFTVTLSNPVGATIGTYTNVTVTIKDTGSQTPVYRLYSYGMPDSTYEHVWTTDWDEMATMSTVYGWYYEGVAWYAFSDYVQGSTPLYRVYAPSIRQHHYTINGTEYYVLTEQSGGAWNGEGIQYYVYPDNSVTGTTPVYRFYHAGMGLHHFTISADEAATIQATPEWGYVYEDIAFYVYP